MPISGKHLFTFAVVADTHMNQSEDYSSSPYPCNALANARTRHVVAELNHLKPEFVLHLGDIINPVPELPTYEDAANHFNDLVKDLEAPLYLVPGNHDVGDKPVSWMPAGMVSDEYLALYERHFGAHYFSLDRDGLHIVVINAPLINSGLKAEAEQKAWLEKDLADNAGKRTFIAIHYPPYVSNLKESGSYDNIDEPGRSWLLELLKKHKPEAMFCGHVHNFWYDLFAETEIYILPSTAFVRHDYAELYRIGPGDQFGRNDEAKLGYFIVRVYEHGHVVENIRTYGRTLAPGAQLPAPPKRVQVPQTKECCIRGLGLDMRHAWAEELVIAPSGGVDEFERKLARNDYPVLALWEMGLKRLRVPIQDLIDERTRDRMRIMIGSGQVFQVYSYGVPSQDSWAFISAHADLIEAMEIVINWENAAETVKQLAMFHAATEVPVYLSRVNRKDANKHTGGRYNHLISHGFVPAESDELTAFLAEADGAKALAGLMMSVMRDRHPLDAAADAQALAARIDKTVCLYMKSTLGAPYDTYWDDADNASRFAEAALAAMTVPGVQVILDTFDDTDRGYFARAGLVDRRFNPKSGSRIVGNLIGALHDETWSLVGGVSEAAGARVQKIASKGGRTLTLVMPGKDGVDGAGFSGSTVIDLDTGVISGGAPSRIGAPTLIG